MRPPPTAAGRLPLFHGGLHGTQIVAQRHQHVGLLHHGVHLAAHGIQQKPHDRKPLVELRLGRPFDHIGRIGPCKDVVDTVVVAVLGEQVVIHGEPLCDLAVLHVLLHEQLSQR